MLLQSIGYAAYDDWVKGCQKIVQAIDKFPVGVVSGFGLGENKKTLSFDVFYGFKACSHVFVAWKTQQVMLRTVSEYNSRRRRTGEQKQPSMIVTILLFACHVLTIMFGCLNNWNICQYYVHIMSKVGKYSKCQQLVSTGLMTNVLCHSTGIITGIRGPNDTIVDSVHILHRSQTAIYRNWEC